MKPAHTFFLALPNDGTNPLIERTWKQAIDEGKEIFECNGMAVLVITIKEGALNVAVGNPEGTVLPLGITYPFPIPLDIYLSEVETDE